MSDNRKSISELHNDIRNLKLELDAVFNNFTNLVNTLELRVGEVINNNQIMLPDKDNNHATRESNIKTTLKTARATMHDLAQPLTILIGRCELLEMLAHKDPVIKRHVESMLSNAKKVEKIVKKVQSLNSKIARQCDEKDSMEVVEKIGNSKISETKQLKTELYSKYVNDR